MEESAPLIETLVSPGLIICYIFFGVALVASIGMPLVNAIKNPAGLMKALIGVVGLVVIFAVSYGISGSEVTAKAVSYGVDASSTRLIGAGMITFYIFLICSMVLAIYSLVKDIITG
ncbi:MAG: hypothetical protein IM606_07240 [Cytophagales bacterium]|jgi:hypothetical protein|nr:hypothetical protein [Cytophagales bacterium]MCA6387704.1 hypothetical protein [Cytophagales bacterium]MCA6393351.1 hypothetical protein [Cytophagales bacterium]MCA6394968.1 hypothetical protein [Cytophagales bacterium]MCA6398784.1 hypothetical protein [Cytophagales bacterium]